MKMTTNRCGRLLCSMSAKTIALLLLFCASVGAGRENYFPSSSFDQASDYGPTMFSEKDKQLGFGPRMNAFGPKAASYGPQMASYGPGNAGSYGFGENNFPSFANLPSVPSFQNPLARSGLQGMFKSYTNPFVQQENVKGKEPSKASVKPQQQKPNVAVPAFPQSFHQAAYFPQAPEGSSVTYSSSESASPGGVPKVYRSYQMSSAGGGHRQGGSSHDSNKYSDGDVKDSKAAAVTGGKHASSGTAYANNNQYSDGSSQKASNSDRNGGGSQDKYNYSYSTSSNYDSKDPKSAAKSNKTNSVPFARNAPNLFFPRGANPGVPASVGPGSTTLISGGGVAKRGDIFNFGNVLGSGPGLGNVGRVFNAGNAEAFQRPGGVFGRSGFPFYMR